MRTVILARRAWFSSKRRHFLNKLKLVNLQTPIQTLMAQSLIIRRRGELHHRSFMDIKRPPKAKFRKRTRTAILLILGLAAVGGITYGLAKLKPAAPTMERSAAVIDTVKRGEMIRQVRGN